MFLLPGLVIAWTVSETPIPDPYCIEIKNYLSPDGTLRTAVGDCILKEKALPLVLP